MSQKMIDAIKAVRELNGTASSDELSKFDKLPQNLKEAMERKIKERHEKAAEVLAENLIDMLDKVEKEKQTLLAHARSMNRQYQITVEKVKKYHAAQSLAKQGDFSALLYMIDPSTFLSEMNREEIHSVHKKIEDQIKKDASEKTPAKKTAKTA